MRRYIVAAATALTVATAGSFVPGQAEALPVSAPAALPSAVDSHGLVQDVAYVCRRVRTCGPYGCHWRRACYRTGPRYRPYWRHRYYHRYRW
jgi:hypothetical protein